MKLLRNPVVVAILGVVALALVVNSMLPMFKGRRGARAATPAPSPAANVVVSSVQAVPAPAPVKAATVPATSNTAVTASVEVNQASMIDLATIRRDSSRWALGTRDPFQIRSIPAKPVYPRAMEVLTLSAIWRQTDSSLAVLNGRIYMAGDTVQRFLIKSIEPDRVLVQGPNGPEIVEFKTAVTSAASPIAPGNVAVSPTGTSARPTGK